MPEIVGITLASVGLFLQLYDACDRLYHGYKLTRRFGHDFEDVQVELQMQWARFDTLLKRRLVSSQEIDVHNPSHRITSTIYRYISLMERYFKTCHELMKWYDNEGERLIP
jgi:hypothetical protein